MSRPERAPTRPRRRFLVVLALAATLNSCAPESPATEVRVFDSTGRYLRTIVRRGEGPDEIGEANGIFLPGDTLS